MNIQKGRRQLMLKTFRSSEIYNYIGRSNFWDSTSATYSMEADMPEHKQTLKNTSLHEICMQGDEVRILDKYLNPKKLLIEITRDGEVEDEHTVLGHIWDEDAQVLPEFQFKQVATGMVFTITSDGLEQLNVL